MNPKQIVKITNGAALISVGLLSFWVFIFVSITVFDFKVFRENITEAFYLSIFGILSLLAAAIILNVMMNMTRIADHFDGAHSQPAQNSKRLKFSAIGLLLTFPLTFGLLYLGDLRSAAQKRDYLVDSGEAVISEQSDLVKAFTEYEFSKDYIQRTSETLKVLSRTDENFPDATVIVRDKINSKPVFLEFTQFFSTPNGKEQPFKTNFLYSASADERRYLNRVFDNQTQDPRFSAHDGNYELYFPVTHSERTVVIYFSDRSRYGKIGS